MKMKRREKGKVQIHTMTDSIVSSTEQTVLPSPPLPASYALD